MAEDSLAAAVGGCSPDPVATLPHADDLIRHPQKRARSVIDALGTDRRNSFIDRAVRSSAARVDPISGSPRYKLRVKQCSNVPWRRVSGCRGHVGLLMPSLTHTTRREALVDFFLFDVVTGRRAW